MTGERVPGKLMSSLGIVIAHRQRSKCCEFHPEGFLAHLEAPIHIERDLTMTTKQKAFYQSMEKDLAAFLTQPGEDGKIPVVAEVPIAARGMLRFCALGLPSYNEETERLYFDEMCESPKLDALIADIESLDGAAALVLTHSAQFAEVTVKRLLAAGISAELWRGGMSKKRRAAVKASFISGETTAIVGVISAMGTGTDGLQEAAWNVMWLSVDDDASNDVQGIGRLDRIGQKHQVVMTEYRMLGTFDVGHLPRQVMKQLELNKSMRVKK